ncbi:MAG: hypothetical protein AAF997_12625 [Myxococcota bacterium]
MSNGDERPIRRGDRAFVLRLLGGSLGVLLIAILLLNVLDTTDFGGCAARGFNQVTESPPSD